MAIRKLINKFVKPDDKSKLSLLIWNLTYKNIKEYPKLYYRLPCKCEFYGSNDMLTGIFYKPCSSIHFNNER